MSRACQTLVSCLCIIHTHVHLLLYIYLRTVVLLRLVCQCCYLNMGYIRLSRGMNEPVMRNCIILVLQMKPRFEIYQLLRIRATHAFIIRKAWYSASAVKIGHFE